MTREEAAKKKAESYAEAQKRKKEKKAMLAAASQKGQAASSDQPEFTKMDIRIGEITKVVLNAHDYCMARELALRLRTCSSLLFLGLASSGG